MDHGKLGTKEASQGGSTFASQPVQQHFEFEALNLTQSHFVSILVRAAGNMLAGVYKGKGIPLILR